MQLLLVKAVHLLVLALLLSYTEPNVAPSPQPKLMLVSCFVWPQEQLRMCYFPDTKCYILYALDARGNVINIEIEWCITDGYLIGG